MFNFEKRSQSLIVCWCDWIQIVNLMKNANFESKMIRFQSRAWNTLSWWQDFGCSCFFRIFTIGMTMRCDSNFPIVHKTEDSFVSLQWFLFRCRFSTSSVTFVVLFILSHSFLLSTIHAIEFPSNQHSKMDIRPNAMW